MSKYARRVDLNQKDIVDGARKLGFAVLILSEVGQGVPDLYVEYPANGFKRLVEIKSEGGKLNEREQRWHAEWRGDAPLVIYDLSELCRAAGVRTS